MFLLLSGNIQSCPVSVFNSYVTHPIRSHLSRQQIEMKQKYFKQKYKIEKQRATDKVEWVQRRSLRRRRRST